MFLNARRFLARLFFARGRTVLAFLTSVIIAIEIALVATFAATIRLRWGLVARRLGRMGLRGLRRLVRRRFLVRGLLRAVLNDRLVSFGWI